MDAVPFCEILMENILSFEYDKRFWQALRSLPFQHLEEELKTRSFTESEEYIYRKLSPIVRKILDKPRFNSAEKLEVSDKLLELTQEYLSKRRVRADRSLGNSLCNQYIVKQDRLKQEHFKKVFATAKNIFLNNYRQPQSSWAGGKTTVRFEINPLGGQSVASYRAWSNNGKWSGSNLGGTINIQPNWYRQIYKAGIAECQGLMTTHATKLKRCFWQATWLEQSRGMSLKLIEGYIYKSRGEYFHGKSESACKATAKRYFANQVEREKRQSHLFSESGFEEFANLKVDRRLSALAGNCQSGTESWLNLHGFGDRSTVSVRELYLADPKNPRVLAVIQYAIARAESKQLVEVN